MPAMGALKSDPSLGPESVRPLLEVLDRELQDREYICGQLSVADFAIASYTLTKLGRKLDYSGLPNLSAWRERVSQLDGFTKTLLNKNLK
jgi:glutathione S-transferase